MAAALGTKEHFFAALSELVALAKNFPPDAFDEAAPEETTKHRLIRPLLKSLGYEDGNIVPEFKIVGDEVDYLLKSDRPLLFFEAKPLIDVHPNLFEGHQEQVLRYIRNYRVSPEQVQTERPVAWIILSNFAQWHFIRVTEERPSFSFKLDQLIPRREEFWELLARENVEAGRLEELYDQSHKADLDKRFLADLKRWRLLIANGFALRNQKHSVEEITLASQQLLDRFIFSRMLETYRLIEWNKLARAYTHYDEVYGSFEGKTFAEFLRESLFQEIKFKFNTELFQQPLLCDELAIANEILSVVVGHESLHSDLADHCGIGAQGEIFPFRHLYLYDFSRMSQDIMGAVYERFLAHKLFHEGGRIVIEDTDELRKKEGIYYTPQYIVDYIVAHTLGEKIRPILAEALSLLGYKNYKGASSKIRELAQIKVLDPATGSGSFLLCAFDKLVEAYTEYNTAARKAKADRSNGSGMLFDDASEIAEEIDHLGVRVATENIFGVDLDPQAIEVAKLNLWMRLMAVERDFIRNELYKRGKGSRPLNFLPDLRKNLRRGNSLIADKAVAGNATFDWQAEFPETMKRGGFDIVIGNPPYERIQTMMGNAPKAVEFLKANYRSAASGNFDIYVCFIERGLQMLNHEGFLGYICPNKFFQSEYGGPLRLLLSEEKKVQQIINFGHEQIFPQATIYTCLLFLCRTSQKSFLYFEVDDLEKWRGGEAGAPARVSAETLTGTEWNFVSSANQPLFDKINSQPLKLEAVADIFVGLQTSADDVFILDFISEDKSTIQLRSRSLGAEWTFERGLLHPLVSGTDVTGYGALPRRQFIIFPYTVNGDKAHLVDFDEIQKQFPKTAEYLSQNRATLESREGGKVKNHKWHGYIYLKNLTRQALPKLCVPRLVNELHAGWDAEGAVFLDNVDVGGVTVKPEFQGLKMTYLLALLNSCVLRWFFPFVSVPFRGDYLSANRQFLGQLPIKLIDLKNKHETRLEEEIVERVEAIHTACKRLSAVPEMLGRKIRHTQNRTPCNLAHYLQKDFAGAVKSEILIDDVQRKGFVREIELTAKGQELTLSATVADDAKSDPKPLPVLRIEFQHEPLRQFIYAFWRQFLEENSRKKKWTTGKKPEPIYPLMVNTLEPLVYFQPAAADNLRFIRDLMEEIGKEAGSSDLSALESEIENLDKEINERVCDLYGLTQKERAVVEGAAGRP